MNREIFYHFWEVFESRNSMFLVYLHAVIPSIYGFFIEALEPGKNETAMEKGARYLHGRCGVCFRRLSAGDWVRYCTRIMFGLLGNKIALRTGHTTMCATCSPRVPFVLGGKRNFQIFDDVIHAQWKELVELAGGALPLEFLDCAWCKEFLQAIEQTCDLPNRVRRADSSCDFCGQDVQDLKRCSHCHLVHYCSKTCQRKHWKLHRVTCRWYEGQTWLTEDITFHRAPKDFAFPETRGGAAGFGESEKKKQMSFP